MRALIALVAVFYFLVPVDTMAQEDHGNKTFHVQAWDYTDSSLLAGSGLDMDKGVPCAEVLAILMGQGRNQKYELLEATGVQGPPGVTYTLINYSGQVAIVKCGTAGCGSGDDGGHEPGAH